MTVSQGQNVNGSIVETFEKYQNLEEQAVMEFVEKHNYFLSLIEDLEERMYQGLLGTVELARIEYYYAKAQLCAYAIAGYHREKMYYYEAMAEQHQANMYEHVRLQKYDPLMYTSTDGQYMSRRAKGKQLELAAKHAGDYTKWQGIAESYTNAIHAIKDMIKREHKEQEGYA
jgi:hypothetical protein